MASSELVGVRVEGTGSYLPERVVTNDDLSKVLDTNDEWIRTRTGISTRHWAADDQGSVALAVPAARRAIEDAGVTADEIDLIVCTTLTPDYPMPTNAALLQRALELPNAGGFDINSACSGFVAGFQASSSFVRSGASKCCLLVATEKMSSVTDPTERSTRVIFGDGAGAVILKPSVDRSSDVLAMRRGLKGDDDTLLIRAGGSRYPVTKEMLEKGAQDTTILMKGRETFKFAVRTFTSLIKGTCEDAGIDPAKLKLVVPHQVNLRILEAACSRSGVSLDSVMINIGRVGNTSAASVAIALDEANREGRLERGDLIALVAFGGGLSWASALVRW
jgi:3-oxoacyl-[acyl-carrier-protein] synthase III